MSRGLASVLGAQGLQTTITALLAQSCHLREGTCIGGSCQQQIECSHAGQIHQLRTLVNWDTRQQQQQLQQQWQQDQHSLQYPPWQQQQQQRYRQPSPPVRSTGCVWPQQHVFQQQPALGLLHLHTQASLMQCLPALQQPWGQPAGTPFRAFTSSTALAAAKKHTRLQPVPHQPAKHVPGTDPLKVVKAASNIAMPSSSSISTPGAAEAAVVQQSPPNLGSRIRAAAARQWQSVRQAANDFWAGVEALPWRKLGTAGVLCMMTASVVTSLYLVTTNAVLKGSPGNLRSNDPQLQVLAVDRLRSVVGLLPQGWDDLAQQMVAAGLLEELAALIRPGTDAVVLNATCKLLNKLLDQGGSMERDMIKAGIAGALTRSLQEGWLPKGAAEAVTAVNKRLEPPVAPVQAQKQHWWQRSKPALQ